MLTLPCSSFLRLSLESVRMSAGFVVSKEVTMGF